MRRMFLLSLLFLGMTMGAQAQLDPDMSVLPFMRYVKPFMDRIENDYHTINRVEIDLIFDGSVKSVPLNLYDGKSYTIMAIGEDNRIGDLDFNLQRKIDGEWQDVKTATSSTNVAEMKFVPNSGEGSDIYFLDLTATDWKNGYGGGRFCVIVYY